MQFKNGQRVRRDGKQGTITRCFSRESKTIGGVCLGPYPELYAVSWDDGSCGRAYLPHGLRLIKEREK